MRLEQLSHIVAVEQKQSVSKAARGLFISQPSLSRSISSLEQELNVQIFKRSAQGTIPTLQGREILVLAKTALDCIAQMKNFTCSSEEVTGDVYLLITPAYSFIVYDLVVNFKNQYPCANLIIKEKTKLEILEDISTGLCNLGVTAWGTIPGVEDVAIFEAKHLGYETFLSHTLLVYVSAKHPLAQRDTVCWEEIAEEKFVFYSQSTPELLKGLGFEISPSVMILSDRDNLKKLIMGNFAISVLPDNYARNDIYIQQGLIKTLKIEGLESVGYDRILYGNRQRLTYLEACLLETLRMLFQQDQGDG